MPLEIRPAASAEFPAVAELCVAAYAPFLTGDGEYLAVLRDVARRASEAELLVAAEPADGDVLGTVTFVPDGGPLGEIAEPSEAEFPHARRRARRSGPRRRHDALAACR